MRAVTVSLTDRSYPILIGHGILDSLGAELGKVGLRGQVALVHDAAIPHLAARAEASLRGQGFSVLTLSVPSGEGSKSLEQFGRLNREFAAAALDRSATVVALGGGVTGDLAGFAAASYLRGVAFVQVPTTLLAQVDASVGGKTGIDLPEGKNLVGAFHQPRLVVADLESLTTLPPAELSAGLAEVVKTGVIADPEFFQFLEQNSSRLTTHYPEVLEQVVARCCEIKADVVRQDERESGLRAILNYGHTVGHAVEAVAGYGTYLHGEAVSIGMVAAGRLSQRHLGLEAATDARVEGLLAAVGLPVRLREPLNEEALVAAMKRDKKVRAGELRFVLARALGQVETVAVPEAEARRVLDVIQPRATNG